MSRVDRVSARALSSAENQGRFFRGRKGFLSACLIAGLALSSVPSAQLPQGFQERIVFSGLTQPTAIQFSPDGRVFVSEKSGLIKVFDDLNDPTPTVFADFRQKTYNYWDRGMIGMALDPAFPTAPYVYLLYTYDAPIGGTAPTWNDACPTPPGPNGDGCVASGRLVRVQADGNVMVGGEQILIEDWCIQYVTHSVGTLTFGPDGALYVSGGEGAGFTFVDYGQRGNPCGDPPLEGGALRSQDIRTQGDPLSFDGCVLRVNPVNGEALPDNPLYGGAWSEDDRVIAYGLRNPFRMTFHPTTDELWIGDVGRGRAEEINRLPDPLDAVIENYGWPCYEGFERQNGFDAADLPLCESLYGSGEAVDPYFSYIHGDPVAGGCTSGASAISGIAFYNGGNYPLVYQDAMFFSDYSRRCIWVVFAGQNGLPDMSSITTFIDSQVRPVDLKIGPGGNLFYVDINSGTVRTIEYFVGNQPPTAVIAADQTLGPSPLTVQFDALGSSDPDVGDVLTYEWDLDGDGAYDDSTAAQPQVTFTESGNVTVRLRVTDPGLLTATDQIVITVDNQPPVATILDPQAITWRVGEEILYSGEASVPGVGPLPDSALSWSLILHHCDAAHPTDCHEHYLEEFHGVASGSFNAPDHEYPSHLELILTASESGGEGWWDVAWARRRQLSLGNAGQSEDLVDFPVLVRLDGTRIDYSRTLPGGADLRFLDADNTPLDFEIETWDPLGDSLVWVRVPTVDALSDTDHIWMYYGNNAALDAQDPVGVWGLDHAAVWHMDFGTDSSAAGNHATVSGASSVLGRLGNAWSFDGLDDFLDVPTSPSLELLGQATIEAWVQVANPDLNRAARILSKKTTWAANAGYGLEYNPGQNKLTLLGGGGDFGRVLNLDLDSQWHHIVAVIDGTSGRMFVDGVERAGNTSVSPLAVGTEPLRIGRRSGGGDFWFGSLDEVRVSNVARSPSWIAAQYLSMSDLFVTFGDEESPMASTASDSVLIFPETVPITMETDPPGLQVALFQDLQPSPFFLDSIIGGQATISAPSPQFRNGVEYEFVGWSDGGEQSHDIVIPETATTYLATYAPVGPPGPIWWDADWQKRTRLGLDNSGLGSDLPGFPVLVVLDATRIDYSLVQNDGQDLRFVAEDHATLLPHSVELWDETGVSYVWVGLQALPAEQNPGTPEIWIYYDNPGAPDSQSPEQVWDANFRSVWHLEPGLQDETSNGNDGTNFGTQSVQGSSADGRVFDGADDYIDAGSGFDITGPLTLEAWVQVADPGQVVVAQLFSKKVNYGGGGGYALVYQPNADRVTLLGSGRDFARAGGVALDSSWHHLAAVIDGSEGRIFLDGNDVTSDSTVSPLASNNVPLHLGKRTNRTSGYWNGSVDEVRVSDVARSPEWLAMQVRSMNDSLLQYGPQEDLN